MSRLHIAYIMTRRESWPSLIPIRAPNVQVDIVDNSGSFEVRSGVCKCFPTIFTFEGFCYVDCCRCLNRPVLLIIGYHLFVLVIVLLVGYSVHTI